MMFMSMYAGNRYQMLFQLLAGPQLMLDFHLFVSPTSGFHA